MTTYDELARLYGEDNIIRLDAEASLARGITPEDAEFLAHTGMPTYVDVLFTLRVSGNPKVFTVASVDSGRDSVDVFILGAPTDDPDLRYFIDLRHRYVVLFAASSSENQAEIVNTSLGDFIEFLYRISLHKQRTADSTSVERSRAAHELHAYLEARDPLAFSEPDSWWSMILGALKQ
ncbi:SUKH-4 family immunity protein [Streptomyces sp. NPDC020141]|uniref:SUKH-4 family immunity protein n=1 Tax=Streptomyces sp. NPDC020141 TaxID=3365065 RepID=UPI0037AF125D